MADSLVFLASMCMANRGHAHDWKLLDVASEARLFEEARTWKDYRELHDRFNDFLEI